MSYEFISSGGKVIVSPPSSSDSLVPRALHPGWAQALWVPNYILFLLPPCPPPKLLLILFSQELTTSKFSFTVSQEAVSDSFHALWEHSGFSIL